MCTQKWKAGRASGGGGVQIAGGGGGKKSRSAETLQSSQPHSPRTPGTLRTCASARTRRLPVQLAAPPLYVAHVERSGLHLARPPSLPRRPLNGPVQSLPLSSVMLAMAHLRRIRAPTATPSQTMMPMLAL